MACPVFGGGRWWALHLFFILSSYVEEAADAEAEALHQQVFANEKGFLESTAFNPARAREKQEEEQVQALAAKWGSTPERAKEAMKVSQEGKDMSFQVCTLYKWMLGAV